MRFKVNFDIKSQNHETKSKNYEIKCHNYWIKSQLSDKKTNNFPVWDH